VVDGQRMKYAPGVLESIATELADTAVVYCFNKEKLVGVVESGRMVGPNLEVTVKLAEEWATYIKGKPITLRPGFQCRYHEDGLVVVIDEITTIWISIVPEELSYAIDAEAEVRGALLLKQMEDAKDEPTHGD